MNQAKILIIDDEKRMCIVLKQALENELTAVTTADSGEAAMAAMEIDRFDVVLSDMKMPGMSGMDVLRKVKQESPDTEVMLMTAYADTQSAVEAMKTGAYDYIIKPFEIAELRHKIDNILEKRRLATENIQLKKQLRKKYSLENMVGKSGAMQRVYELVEKVSASDATVLIRGESGTGKELVASAIHNLSRRKDQPLVAVNCGALPESLLESELFGHEKGAFTGANRQKLGRFELAGKGTIFLDEIGDVTTATQIKLLRVLQAREIVRLGGTETIRIQARTIAATNRNLEEAVKNNTFREDLYYRINVFPIFLPPLRDRKEDIPDLVAHFLQMQVSQPDKIAAKALRLLIDYAWPGNVRELENVIGRSLIMAGDDMIKVSDLPPHIRGESEMPIGLDTEDEENYNMNEMEKRLIHKALARAEGNKTRAAKMLGITRRQLYSKMERMMQR
jgi:two-component system response regulator AtoC